MWIGNNGIEFTKTYEGVYESNNGIVLKKVGHKYCGNNGRDYWFDSETNKIYSNCGIEGRVVDEMYLILNNGLVFYDSERGLMPEAIAGEFLAGQTVVGKKNLEAR